MQDRVPPQNIEAEQSVLGAMLIEKEAIPKVMEILRDTDFYREAHRVIFNAMLELYNKNEAVDMITVTEILKRDNKLEDVGGIAYVTSLANTVPTAANVTYHASIIEEKSILRQLVSVSTQIASMGYEANDDVKNIIDSAESKILEISNRKKTADFTPINEIVLDSFKSIEALMGNKNGLTGLPTGFEDLDNLTSGLHGSDFIILAARPSMGKTAFALNVVQNVAIRAAKKVGGAPKTVAFFSLEMSKEQLVQRMLCAEANIDSQRLRIGELRDEDWAMLINTADTLSSANIYIDDTAGITAMDMRSRARRLKAEHGLDLIVVDYLQLMQGSGKKNNSGDRQQEVSEISRSLKALARELDVPVIALSQLSRSVEARQVKRPMLSDLRESGSLEQDADIVAFLYREDYYNPETENKNITELIIAKHRNGPVDTVNLFFHKQYTKFVGLSKRKE
ncbi:MULTISPECIES: replicative DNA helicase [Phascolarctobacterium]|jgi:replicative DNA helicase|uniref:replicative DNA helicase n=1 Tax=Phascolarctobacterium TaxID=33024 RepID=UPI00267231C0|nr:MULTISPECIES: replicative DNA helicase [Phascolarctobacterium]MDR3831547.1 replicative DNA helicase [Phascolarctobacterium sp.]